MKQRLNVSAVAPAGLAALRAVEQYVEGSGLDPKLILLVKIRVSQINGCAYCLHMHTEHAHKLGSPTCEFTCSMPGTSRIFFRHANALPSRGRNRLLKLQLPMHLMMFTKRRGVSFPNRS